MAPLRDSRQIAKTIKKYRLAVAKAILRYDTDIFHVLMDIQAAQEITELCDSYAIKILLDWLGTKYGFPQAVRTATNDHLIDTNSLDAWAAIRNEYPFSSCGQLGGTAFEQAEKILESALTPDLSLIGSIYEKIADEPIQIDQLGQPYIKKEKKRHLVGQFYTPAWVVDYCFDRVLKESLARLTISANEILSGRTNSEHSNAGAFKILDPACGTGNFLIGAIDWLGKHGVKGDQLIAFAQNSVYGIDLDGRAVSLCRIGLLLSLSSPLREFALSSNAAALEIKLQNLLLALKRHVTIGDTVFKASLLGDTPHAEVGFDLIATNPPYLSFGSRNQIGQLNSTAKYLRHNYPDSSEYKIRLHSVFQEIAIRYGCLGGQIVLFLPDAFLTGSYYGKIRRKLLQHVQIQSLTELPEDVIKDATVGRWCVASYKLKEKEDERIYDVCLSSYVDDAALKRTSNNIPELVNEYILPIAAMVTTDKSRFRLVFHDLDRQIWQHVDQLPYLASVLAGHTGIRARHGQSSIVSPTKRFGSWHKGIRSGAQVSRHLISWDGTWLNVEPSLLYAGGFDAQIVDGPKIMVRQTADRIIAGLDNHGLYHLNNVHNLSPIDWNLLKDGVDLHYFDGLLNSSLWLYLYQSKSRECGRALAQIDIEMMESMPIPLANKQNCSLISRLARAACRLQAAQRKQKNEDHSDYLKAINLLSLVERAIDCLVYELYQLNAAQVLHVESLCRHKLPFPGPMLDRQSILPLIAEIEIEMVVAD